MPLRRVEFQLSSGINRVSSLTIRGNPAEEGVGLNWDQIATSWNTWSDTWDENGIGKNWDTIVTNWDGWGLDWGQ